MAPTGDKLACLALVPLQACIVGPFFLSVTAEQLFCEETGFHALLPSRTACKTAGRTYHRPRADLRLTSNPISSRVHPVAAVAVEVSKYVPNSTILGTPPNHHRKTLRDLYEEADARSKPAPIEAYLDFLQKHLPEQDIYFLNIWLQTCRQQYRLHPHLPEPGPSSHHVYLVHSARACKIGDIFPHSHLSVYTQGHFYHLSTTSQTSACTISNKQDSGEPRGTQLINQDLTSQADPFETPREKTEQPLIAFEVGQTDLTAAEVLTLAKWIIVRLPVYDVFRSSCHDFAVSLLERVITRQRDFSVFVGTARQLARWDLWLRNKHKYPHGLEHGFVVVRPMRAQEVGLWRRIWASTWQVYMYNCAEICNLYEYGAGVRTVMDPSGAKNRVSYNMHVLKDRLVAGFRKTRAGWAESIEDARAGRWKDALAGRRERRVAEWMSNCEELRYSSFVGPVIMHWSALVLFGGWKKAEKATGVTCKCEMRKRDAIGLGRRKLG